MTEQTFLHVRVFGEFPAMPVQLALFRYIGNKVNVDPGLAWYCGAAHCYPLIQKQSGISKQEIPLCD
jgi:hypothetical protein